MKPSMYPATSEIAGAVLVFNAVVDIMGFSLKQLKIAW
jgi:hypothetical protein